jgi:hypothetical protein
MVERNRLAKDWPDLAAIQVNRTMEIKFDGLFEMRRTFAVVAILLALVVASEPGFARGGAASIMNSPGYQRRLQESRQQLAQPDMQPSSPTVRRKSRHRHQH